MGTPAAERMRQMRARRAAEAAAALAPAEGPPLPEADRLLPAVEESAAALKLGERDAAVVQLARRLAVAIDGASDPAKALQVFGPLLLKVLEAMGATPASRPAVRRQRPGPPSGIARLRAERLETVARRERAAARTGGRS